MRRVKRFAIVVLAATCLLSAGCYYDPVKLLGQDAEPPTDKAAAAAGSSTGSRRVVPPQPVATNAQAEAQTHRLLDEGFNQYESGRYDAAIQTCTELLALKPYSQWAYCLRGCAFHAKGDYAAAVRDQTAAIACKPDFAEAYCYRALAYVEAGQLAYAIADGTTAIALRSDFAEAYYYRGLAYFKRRDYTKSLRDLRTAADLGLAIDPDLLASARKLAEAQVAEDN